LHILSLRAYENSAATYNSLGKRVSIEKNSHSNSHRE